MGASQSSPDPIQSITDALNTVDGAIVDGIEQVGNLANDAIKAIDDYNIVGAKSCDNNSPHLDLPHPLPNWNKLLNGGTIILYPKVIIKYDYIRNRCQTYNAITLPFPSIKSLIDQSAKDAMVGVPNLNVIVNDIAMKGIRIQQDFDNVSIELTKITNFINEINNFTNSPTGDSTLAQKLSNMKTRRETLGEKYDDLIDSTIKLLSKVIVKSQTLFETNITCITEIFENIHTIQNTFFIVDLPKFYSDKHTFKAKMFTINNRNKNLLNKLNTLNVCINVLSVCINEGLYLYTIKILYYIFSKQLIEIWKLIQYTIKYNLIDFHTMNPSLSNLVETEVYSTALQQIILRLLQMIRVTFDFSEILLEVAIHITKIVDVSLKTITFMKYIATTITGSDSTGSDSTELTLTQKIQNLVLSLSPFSSIKAFDSMAGVSKIEGENESIKDILVTIKALINPKISKKTSLKSMMQSIFITFVNCKDETNLNDPACELEFNSTRKKDVNDIKTFINDTQDNIYSKINSISIDISKPYGWSYEENKQDIEDKINSRKT